MFAFCSLIRTNRTVVRKRTLKKNTKQKSENKDNDCNVQSKAEFVEDGDSETVIGMAPPKIEHILRIS